MRYLPHCCIVQVGSQRCYEDCSIFGFDSLTVKSLGTIKRNDVKQEASGSETLLATRQKHASMSGEVACELREVRSHIRTLHLGTRDVFRRVERLLPSPPPQRSQ